MKTKEGEVPILARSIGAPTEASSPQNRGRRSFRLDRPGLTSMMLWGIVKQKKDD